MKIALFGGSFDPPHSGHADIIKALSIDSSFDEIWILPVGEHAFGKRLELYFI